MTDKILNNKKIHETRLLFIDNFSILYFMCVFVFVYSILYI